MDKDSYSNLNRRFKWLGIIDYKSLIILLIYLFVLWNVSYLFVSNIVYRVYIEIVLAIPVIGLFYSNKSSESIFDILIIIIKFYISQKLYVYKLESNNNLLNKLL